MELPSHCLLRGKKTADEPLKLSSSSSGSKQCNQIPMSLNTNAYLTKILNSRLYLSGYVSLRIIFDPDIEGLFK